MDLLAPPLNGLAAVPRQPVVEGSVTLLDAAGNEYVEGADYLESERGFVNLIIEQGTELHVDYFYHAEGPLLASVPITEVVPSADDNLPGASPAPVVQSGGVR